jgi:hypothetical protein
MLESSPEACDLQLLPHITSSIGDIMKIWTFALAAVLALSGINAVGRLASNPPM